MARRNFAAFNGALSRDAKAQVYFESVALLEPDEALVNLDLLQTGIKSLPPTRQVELDLQITINTTFVDPVLHENGQRCC
jgi:hypothetical protein